MKSVFELAVFVATASLASGLAFGATSYRDLHDFAGNADGDTPLTELVADSQGRLYGTTISGGQFGGGTVYRVTLPKKPKGKVALEILHSFQQGDGTIPEGGVLIGADGALYGTANTGGAFNDGTIWRIDPQTLALTKLHDFNRATMPPDGVAPAAGLTAGPNGLLYGTTTSLGPLGGGVAFAISPRGDQVAYSVIHAFGADGDGIEPYIGRLVSAQRKLYGVTEFGGNSHGLGTAFELTLPKGKKSSWTETASIQLGSGQGDVYMPPNGLVIGKDGTLYGCAPGGQSGKGAVYSLVPGGTSFTETLLYSFDGSVDEPFADPFCALTIDSAGRLIGTSDAGGQFGQGTVFSLTNAGGGWSLDVAYEFGAGSGDGVRPQSPLIGTAQGYFLGSLPSGGADGKGALYWLKP